MIMRSRFFEIVALAAAMVCLASAAETIRTPVPDPPEVWLDTVNVPHGGSVDVIMDFTDPVIRGMSVFHCHLLNHEDKGMMAKILFE